ncbi:hypothetical protein MMC30_002699 [Trapelia coarctata]|nr:hypothetical protein [Trapelia coarctata]
MLIDYRTFSDNGTATQPLYGDIAADPSKRQGFANNALRFMIQYGFDGLDIDWEYPGAPDRGGKPEDVKNFVSLLQTLRQTFDGSGRSLGLTFTAPSSYWYLRWFDLPELIKYADWINLMSYDLHGVWDRDNPIGSIVQGHTNLTEIKLAAELLWRVNIPPAKLVMGFGFYGRSFTLADPSCSTPGCQFSGASNPGPCTATGGILSYYEIMAVLNDKSIKPIHDSASAVKYFTFGNNQWVSYDDDVTFKQKVDWANGVGLGGALIWASDLDDSKYSAHAGLLGRPILSTPSLSSKQLSSPQAIIQKFAGENGQQCKMFKECVNLDNPQAADCGKGFTMVGWDDAGCGKKNCHCGKPICCPVNAAPKNCQWRGGKSGDCNGQCLAGEVNIQGYGSSWGGGFKNDGNTNKCGRGRKVFCCEADNWNQLKAGSVPAAILGMTQFIRSMIPAALATSSILIGPIAVLPTPIALQAVIGNQNADSLSGNCAWGRTKVNCCSLSSIPPKPIFCRVNLCDTDPDYCGDGEPAGSFKRDLEAFKEDEIETLEKRAKRRQFNVRLVDGEILRIFAAAYPSAGILHRVGQALRRFFNIPEDDCQATRVTVGALPPGPGTRPETEHPMDLVVIARFIETANSGRLQSGGNTITPRIADGFWLNTWIREQDSLNNLPNIGDGISPNVPNDRVFQGMGSNENRRDLLLTDRRINAVKGRIFVRNAPTALNVFQGVVQTAARFGRPEDIERMLEHIRDAMVVFDYLRDPDVTLRFNRVRGEVRNQLTLIESRVPGAQGLSSLWDEFSSDYFQLIANEARNWATDAIRIARQAFEYNGGGTGIPPLDAARVIAALIELERRIPDMELPRN